MRRKRIISALFALTYCLSRLPAGAQAAEPDSTGLYPHNTENAEKTGDIETFSDAAETPEITPEEVQALVDALPSVEDAAAMDTDSQRTVRDRTRAAYNAIHGTFRGTACPCYRSRGA